ncbi:MAG TPA: arginine deiminase family protein [Kiloniellales bacterium]
MTLVGGDSELAERLAAAALNEYGALRRVMISPAETAFGGQPRLDAVWRDEEFLGRPDFAEALREYQRFAQVLAESGAEIEPFPHAGELGISAIYIRDSSLVAPGGVILCRMRNAYRAAEPAALAAYYRANGIPVVGAIAGDGLLEGGDFVWFDAKTCAVAEGYRTNAEGIRQLREILGPGVDVRVVPLPHDQGPGACLHLMSLISPLDADLALVYSRLMPVPFRAWLLDRGIRLVEVPDEEYGLAMACNVLALAPRKCLVIEGSPVTRARLEAAGCEVIAYKGEEISLKGGGGPTCLTRPLLRG